MQWRAHTHVCELWDALTRCEINDYIEMIFIFHIDKSHPIYCVLRMRKMIDTDDHSKYFRKNDFFFFSSCIRIYWDWYTTLTATEEETENIIWKCVSAGHVNAWNAYQMQWSGRIYQHQYVCVRVCVCPTQFTHSYCCGGYCVCWYLVWKRGCFTPVCVIVCFFSLYYIIYIYI